MDTTFANSFASLCHHKTSIKGIVQDYVIKFNESQLAIENIISKTTELVKQLIDAFNGKQVLGRLVAKVNFIHLNSITQEEEIRTYHFPSFSVEKIVDVEDFFVKHMTKIGNRLHSFNTNGSNLIIKNIEHIHVQLTVGK